MTNNDKILIQDLCARLPYGVYVLVHDTFKYSTVPYENVYLKSSDIASLIDSISLNERYNSRDKRFNRIIKEHKSLLEFKPYLRPMSSMTEEEREEERKLWDIITKTRNDLHYLYTDFLLSHHLDYRGLIPMGLALEATEGMYAH